MKIKPIDGRLLVKPLPPPDKSSSGLLYLAEKKEDFRDYNQREAIVLDVADDYEGSVKVGDRIVYAALAGTPIKAEGGLSNEVEFLIIGGPDVQCILPPLQELQGDTL
jgi:co-chaperonin GroES (HSP10)